MATSFRESFNADYNGSPAGECPPSKVRRTSGEESQSSVKGKGRLDNFCPEIPYFTTTPLGLCVNEFLSVGIDQVKSKAAKTPSSFDLGTISDDILGKCLFNGYLDTFETLKLAALNKRTHNVGRTQIQRLDMRKCSNLTAKQIAKISSTFKSLKCLNFSYCPQFGRDHLAALIGASRNLRDLVLKGTAVDDAALVDYLQQVKTRFGECSIETLDLSAVTKETSYNIGDKAVEAISTLCPKLKCLRLGWCKNLSDEGLASLTKLKHLTELDLSLTGITFKSCQNILQTLGSGLEVLDLSATAIFQVQNDYEETARWISFSKMQNLLSLRLEFCKELSTALFEHIVQNAESLQSIDVKNSGLQGSIQLTSDQARKLYSRNINVIGASIIK